ncbi:hypothetical protein [Rudaeicoccus suwonensis]|uniref:Uncharacterized protein n=1 Tax=Rudaeicoccus suwonensis TaxID=657409 RepID=A0A561E7U9_9MICO|nr:hypothetical protein [Rudaeicoccus suwonensis]TWE11694.1 hypothetical protein BKA23_0475 [Rudaeicoccus suwonensis]
MSSVLSATAATMTDMTTAHAQTYTGSNPLRRLRAAWKHDLGHDERAAILAWASFTLTFTGTRALTHWIKDGHGPKSGGMSLGGKHFHHYNLGIAMLSALGAASLKYEERLAHTPLKPLAYGAANALIADEAALLLDLQDVYWAKDGRKSVDIAIGTIGFGGAGIALVPLIKHSNERRA